jgi:hypothetical protein
MAGLTARKSCKTLHYGWRGRCGRYFTALIRYVLLPIVTFFHPGPFKAALNVFVAEERALRDLEA